MADTKETLEFIDDYRKLPVLWDVNNRLYANKTSRMDASAVLEAKYKLDAKAVKNKIKSLRSYFSKQHSKVIKKKTGSRADDVYASPWFGYKPLLFILDSITPRETKESEETQSGDFTSDEMTPTVETIETASNPENPPQTQLLPDPPRLVNKKRNISKKKEDDNKEDEAYHLMKLAASQMKEKDEAAIFGQMVAAKVRKLTPRNRAIAEKQIQNFLFQIEMQEMGPPSQQLPQRPTQPPKPDESFNSASVPLSEPVLPPPSPAYSLTPSFKLQFWKQH